MAERKQTRPFGPSNEPDTCLYCGVALKYSVFKEQRYRNTVSLCCQAPLTSDYTARWRTGTDHTTCSRCGRELVGDAEDTEVQERVVPERRSEVAGYAGFFCTYDCGYRFGVLAASKGVRYRKVEALAEERSTP